MARRGWALKVSFKEWHRVAIATLLAAALVGVAARELYSPEPSALARVVLAPVPWIVELVMGPGPSPGTPESGDLGGALVHVAMTWIAVVVCFVAYAAVVYGMLSLVGRRKVTIASQAGD